MTEDESGKRHDDIEEVEVYSRTVNAWVVRTPGRHFPALVLQGDSFHQLWVYAQAIHEQTRGSTDAELRKDAEKLRDILWNYLLHYEDTLHSAGFRLPYSRLAWKPEA